MAGLRLSTVLRNVLSHSDVQSTRSVSSHLLMQSDTKITDFAVIICPHIQSNCPLAISQLHPQLRNDVLLNILGIFCQSAWYSCWIRQKLLSFHMASSGTSVNQALTVWNDLMSRHTNFTTNWVIASLSSSFGSFRVVFLEKYLTIAAAPVLLQLSMCFLRDDVPSLWLSEANIFWHFL